MNLLEFPAGEEKSTFSASECPGEKRERYYSSGHEVRKGIKEARSLC